MRKLSLLTPILIPALLLGFTSPATANSSGKPRSNQKAQRVSNKHSVGSYRARGLRKKRTPLLQGRILERMVKREVARQVVSSAKPKLNTSQKLRRASWWVASRGTIAAALFLSGAVSTALFDRHAEKHNLPTMKQHLQNADQSTVGRISLIGRQALKSMTESESKKGR